MRTLLTLAIAAFAVNLAHAAPLFTVACEGYYPEPESPMATTIIASVQRNHDGTFAGLHCFAAEGDPNAVCNIADGGCCACNVARGFTPECSVTVEYSESATAAHCLNMFPPCYYGINCEMPALSALLAEQAPAVTRRKHRRIRLR